jgi:hypothetical protein
MRLTVGRAVIVVAATLPFAPRTPAGVATLGAQGTGGVSTFIAGVADAETGQPLEGAEVILVNAHRLGRANALGEATIKEVPRGPQRVRVRRLGYAPAEVDVAVVGDTSGAVFRLQKSVVQLGAVNVTAEAYTPPRMKDVEARKRQGIGRFLGDEELNHDRDRDFQVSMSARFPGLKTLIDKEGHRVLASSRDAYGLSGIGPCPITIYLDDMLLESGDQDMIRTWDLAAVEWYTGTQVPVRYRTHAYGCGVMLLWSKWY